MLVGFASSFRFGECTMNEFLPDLMSHVYFCDNWQLSHLASWVVIFFAFFFIPKLCLIELLFKVDMIE